MDKLTLENKLVPNLKAIKTALFDKGITYAELGKKINLSEFTIINKLNGKTKFYIDEFFNVSQVVEMEMSNLYTIAPSSPSTL